MALDHIFLPCPAFLVNSEATFLSAALGPLGISEDFRLGSDLVAFGTKKNGRFLWVTGRDRNQQRIEKEGAAGVHVAIRADDKSQVDAFYKAALEAGGTDNGAPGPRAGYPPGYYAFVISPGGHNIEAVIYAQSE